MADEEIDQSDAAPEQGVKPEKDAEETEKDMDTGNEDEDVYTEEGREKLQEDGEISPQEQAYMEGAEGSGKKKGHVRGDPDEELEEEK